LDDGAQKECDSARSARLTTVALRVVIFRTKQASLEIDQIAGTSLTIDDSASLNGNHSLRIDWKGIRIQAKRSFQQLILENQTPDYELSLPREPRISSPVRSVLTVIGRQSKGREKYRPTLQSALGTSSGKILVSALRMRVQHSRCE